MKKINDAMEAERGQADKREEEAQVKDAKKFRDEVAAELKAAKTKMDEANKAIETTKSERKRAEQGELVAALKV